jgi:hypothetical protein
MASIFNLPTFQSSLPNYSTTSSREALPLVISLLFDPLRQTERDHIEDIYHNLPNQQYKHEIQKRFLSLDASNHLGAWYELMVYDWLQKSGNNPITQPSLIGARSKPDFLIQSNSGHIYVEVAVVQESALDEELRTRGSWATAATATFRTMRERLIDKMGQHPGIPEGIPYVVCLCLHTFMIDLGEVKTCLLGGESFNVATGELHPMYDGEIFEQNEDELFVKYQKVSAVLAARSNRSSAENGYKLVFGWVQNPYTSATIQTDEFGDIRRYVIVSRSDTQVDMKWQ